jgi:hypothetical protein
MATNYSIVDKKLLGWAGKLYPEDMIISVRSAEIQEIRDWSNMDENNPLDVSEHVIDMLSSCVKVTSETPDVLYSVKDIYEHDKIALLLLIHMATFPELKKHTIRVNGKCDTEDGCGTEHKDIPVQLANLQYSVPDSKYAKYIDADLGLFNIPAKSYGTIAFKPSTIGMGMKMRDWLSGGQFDNKYISKNPEMFKVIQSMCTNHRTMNAKALRLLQVDKYNNFNADELAFRLELIKKLNISVLGELEFICPSCGATFRCPLEFTRSYKQMFIPTIDFDSELS